MSTVEEIEAAIPKLSTAEVEHLRVWLESHFQNRQTVGAGRVQKKRSALHLRPLSGTWTGERILRSATLAEEMLARK